MDQCLATVATVRSVKSLYGLKRKQLPAVHLVLAREDCAQSAQRTVQCVQQLVPCATVCVSNENVSLDLNKWSMKDIPDREIKVFVRMEGHIDVKRELQRVGERLSKIASQMHKVQTKLDKTKKPEVMEAEGAK
jgi:valyl-tRNA synthetase